MRTLPLLLISAVASTAPTLSAQAVHWSPGSGGNGHWYEFVHHPGGIGWDAANVATFGVPGQHLASIESAGENDFCFALVNNPAYWSFNSRGDSMGPWLGGFQPAGSPEPDGGWLWWWGGLFSYTNWHLTEPNNFNGSEDVLHFYTIVGSPLTGNWNDLSRADTSILGYVAENEFCLADLVPGAAGGPNGLFTHWGTPGNKVYFLASLNLGFTAVPGCSGVFLDLNHPALLGSATTDAAGNASKTILIPGSMAGRTAHFQAADRTGCRVTNVVSEPL